MPKCIVPAQKMNLDFAKFHTEIRPKERTVQQEILDSQAQINKIQKIINEAKYPIKQIATFGNHEMRISKVAMSWGRAFEDLDGCPRLWKLTSQHRR